MMVPIIKASMELSLECKMRFIRDQKEKEDEDYGKTVEGVIRSTFVIDADGVIEHAQYAVKATGHVARLRKTLGID